MVSASVAVLSAWPVAVPRIVMLDAPTVAFAAAVSVSVDALVVVLFGAKAAVTPVGRPSAASVTAPANAPVRVIPMATVLLPLCATLSVAGVRASVYVGAAPTVSASAAVCAVTPVPVARTVRFVVAGVAVAAAVIVMTLDVAVEPMVAGAAAAVTPVGSPSTVTATSPAKPPGFCPPAVP